MRRDPWLGVALCVLWLLEAGCTALREIPRSEYAAVPERQHVRLQTQEGLTYEFDFVRVEGDSLAGFRRQELPGPVDDYATLRVPLDDVAKLSARGLDWYRTGLIGGGVIAAVVAAGLSSAKNSSPPGDNGGGGGGKVP